MNTKLLEKFMAGSVHIDIDFEENDRFNKSANLIDKDGPDYTGEYETVDLDVSISDEDLPDAVESSEQLEGYIKKVIYEEIFGY